MVLDLKSSEIEKPHEEKKSLFKIKPKKEVSLENKPKKKHIKLFIILGIVIVILGGLGFVAYKGVKILEKIGLKIDSSSLSLSNEDPELKKDSTGKYTNILVAGINEEEGSGGLTDTIMILSYNYDTNTIVMTSIPRDMQVEIGEGSNWYSKINSVYESADEDMTALQSTVEDFTGMEIQYYALVNFAAFEDIIDAVGGIDINVERSFTDYLYPLGKSYQTVSFKAGVQHMDGATALKYARSRHSADVVEGTDFARAKRQQKVILAIKDKVLSTSTLTSPKALMEIISSVAKNIKISEFSISDIQAALNLAKTFNDNNGLSYSFVLDPSSANGKIITEDYVAGVKDDIYPKLGLGKYTDINEYIDMVLANPSLYSENAKIFVYNIGLGYQETLTKVTNLQKTYPYLNIVFKGTLYSSKEGNYIYASDDSDYVSTLKEFATTLNITNQTKPDYITTNLNSEGVTILLGKEVSTEE